MRVGIRVGKPRLLAINPASGGIILSDLRRLSCFESVVSYCGIGTRALETLLVKKATAATESGILNIKYIEYIE